MKNDRIERLQKTLKNPYFTSDTAELKYLAGYNGSSGGLLVTPEYFFFMTDSRYALQYENIFGKNFVLVQSTIIHTLCDILKKEKILEICVNPLKTTLDFAETIQQKINGLKIIHDKNSVTDMRLLKTREEIEFIKEAIKITEDGFLYILSVLKEGISEKDVAVELEYSLKRKGADNIAFPLIILFGERSAYPHGVPSPEVKLKKCDVVLIDMGVVYKNYHSDLTRTLCFGKIPSDFSEVYSVVLEAQQRGFEAIKPDVKGKQIDRAARDFISQKGYGDYFGHGLGHGVGLEIHEAPRINPETQDTIRAGMVFSNEPGIYLPGKFGIRIEDMVVCRKNHAEWLTGLPKDEILCI